MLADRLLGRKVLRDKYNFPIAVSKRKNMGTNLVAEQVRQILTGEDQKIILMVRG